MLPLVASKDISGYQAVAYTMSNPDGGETLLEDDEPEQQISMDAIITKVQTNVPLTQEESDAFELFSVGDGIETSFR